jgi:hypothetical protein
MSSRFAWLPSVFHISETGRASIVGYVNGLGVRSDHPALYAALENVFTLALPLIEQSLNAPFERVFTESYQRWQERRAFLNQPERYDGMKPQAWLDFQAEQQRRKAEGFYSRKLDDKQPAWEVQLRGPIDLKGRDLKVIVKVRRSGSTQQPRALRLTPVFRASSRSPSITSSPVRPTRDRGTSRERFVPHDMQAGVPLPG